MEGGRTGVSRKNRGELIDIVFSWSIDDIFNQELYKHKVEKIPNSFESIHHYLNSFYFPLLEETRAELCSKLESISSEPYAEVIYLQEESKRGKSFIYDVKVVWRSSTSNEPTHVRKGDIVLVTDAKPETISDFQWFKYRTWSFGYVTKSSFGDEGSLLKVNVSQDLQVKDGLPKKLLYVATVTNITTNQRIWDTLHSFGREDVINEVLYTTTSRVQRNCNMCPLERNAASVENLRLASHLDESQSEAVVSAVSKMQCNHKSFVELIWGPPGTGKTRTVSILLWSLLRLGYRTLACSPTNVAITELASRVLELVKDSPSDDLCSLGDILLFGNMSSKTSDIEDVFLDYRVGKLVECFGEASGWKCCFKSMIDLLDNCVSQYYRSVVAKNKSFVEFMRERFRATATLLKTCISTICTHAPRNFIMEHNFKNMLTLVHLIDSFQRKLFEENPSYEEELVEVFSDQSIVASSSVSRLLYLKNKCLWELRALQLSLNKLNFPNVSNRGSVEEFCFRAASLIFCTTSNAYRLRQVEMQPIELLVIDEAAQLKECESIIPLNISSIRHAILIGDECQLPAMVNSKVCDEAGFGRSMFERLSILGHTKHLLNKQYRMHPSISFFPNKSFYKNQIIDAPSVQNESYRRSYLPGPMFGPYSFINISGGREVLDEGHSRKNMVEVAVVLRIIQLLFKACTDVGSITKVSVMVISPYSAQVAAIQKRLGHKYENNDSFTVKVSSIDGCQGGEEDIVILSTVRSNRGGSVGFTSNPNRTNVALTRARYCCWILGNEQTLSNSGSIWEDVVFDAKVRQCCFDADEDKDLGKVIMDVKKDLDQLEDLLNSDSTLFKKAIWKVIFSDNFKKSFFRLKSMETKNLILLYLSKLSSGWRPKRGNVRVCSESSYEVLKQYKVGGYYIIASVDLVKESRYKQAFKVWDVLLLHDIPKLVKHLENIFRMYTEDYLSRCGVICVEGELEVPMTWPGSPEIVQHKSLGGVEMRESSDAADTESKTNMEKTHIRDSLSLMKFYSLSAGVLNYLLSSCDGKELALPFELTEQEKEIVDFKRSTFVLGRSGTGKTTVLTMKLFQNEQLYHIASQGFHEVMSNPSTNVRGANESDAGEGNKDVLRQIFLTVSPKLCYAVKQHVSQMKRSVCGGSSSSDVSSIRMDEMDDVSLFADIPDSFVNIPPKTYPLVITFRKFLLMLDGTVGVSYFKTFSEMSRVNKSRSVALEAFIRTKEVNFEKFCSSYWPHFKSLHKQNLDPSEVFTEIMSVLKGGLQEGDKLDTKVSHEEYISLSNRRGSTLSVENREAIYNIFLDYEKKKRVNCEFDLADLVIDIHRRLKSNRFLGDEMDFVYVDEVQDLSMRQIALFKYICRNVEEGFAFCGDTAQTIAKGIDFRFEDIRRLFFNEFLMGAKRQADKRKEKGQVSRTFHLRQNFRTHDGVLKLAQSIINLIYHFFPHSIDVLSPETSLLRGEAPILLTAEENENAVKTMFKNMENFGGQVAGFGAEQVILVRDDCLRNEVCEYVGKKALVLTILDCKGLEFEGVLLYNFFSSSPFKKEWKVIYEYMKEKDLLDSSFHVPFKGFSLEKHGGLCSELKQLYVAITRTKQRLWICEDELSGPVVDYWIKLCLVKERVLDDSFMKEILVDSSQEEWKSRGIKLFHEKNYETAIMCFERAGDFYWQRLTEAYSLRAAAERVNIMKAAEVFDSIGKHELAAQCFFEINEYKRAGTIYMENFGGSKLEKAGECFTLARCFKLAAEVYGRARLYEKCISACTDGKFFTLRFQYIQYWKQNGTLCGDKVTTSVQDFMERGAIHYYELKDKKNMMKFVTSFNSKESMRTILKNLKCLDDLITLESEWGNFIEAANLANMKGDIVLEADLLEKAGYLKESSMLLLWFVFSSYLRQLRSKCRTLKPFPHKEKILEKAKIIAKNHSGIHYKFVCIEAEILSRGQTVKEALESGLQFLQLCKQRVPTGLERVVKTTLELTVLEQELLERCALYHHDVKNSELMMKYVSLFESIAQKRSFLISLNCLDELISLEEEQGNLVEAARIAEQRGDLVRESSLLERSGNFKEASELILFYALIESLWGSGSNGWPLTQFCQKAELLTKAKSHAKNHSLLLYMSVCMEANVLSNQQRSLFELKEYLDAFERQKLLRGEIVTSWRILDAHLNMMPAMYVWNDTLLDSKCRVSVETLVYFWDRWMQKILKLINYLCGNDMHDASEYEEFCLNYFGLRKNHGSEDSFYSLLNPNAIWVKKISSRLVGNKGSLARIASNHFFAVALDYWYNEVHRVSVEVLDKLEKLHAYSVENKFSLLQQSICLVRVFETAKLLQNYESLNRQNDTWILKKYFDLSTEQFFCNVFHIDWNNSMTDDMVSLRGNRVCVDMIEEAILGNIMKNSRPSYGQMGRVATMVLGFGKQNLDVFDKIMKRFDANLPWRNLFEKLKGLSGSSNGDSLVYAVKDVIEDTFNADWKTESDYISPVCFLYLLERLVILVSRRNGYFFTSRSSCIEWLIYEDWSVDDSATKLVNELELTSSMADIYELLAFQVKELLVNKVDTTDWISMNNLEEFRPLIFVRLVVLFCLICTNSKKHFDTLFELLGRGDVSAELPPAFVDPLQRSWKCFIVDALAEALGNMDNPLVIVNLTENIFLKSSYPSAILLDMNVSRCREDIQRELFRGKCGCTASCSDDREKKYRIFWEFIDTLRSLDSDTDENFIRMVPLAPVLKVNVDKVYKLLSDQIDSFRQSNDSSSDDQELYMEADSILIELKQLSLALDFSENGFKDRIESVVEISKRLWLRRPRLKLLLDRILLHDTKNDARDCLADTMTDER